MELPPSSIEGLQSPREDRGSVWARRVVLALVVALVAAGAVGLVGVRTAQASPEGSGWHLEVQYAATARAGLDVPWQVTVHHDGGFDGPIRLAVTGTYFDIFESQGVDPQPDKETSDGDRLYLDFNPPDSGDTFQVGYDVYIQPASQQGAAGEVSVVDHGRDVVTVPFRTRLLP